MAAADRRSAPGRDRHCGNLWSRPQPHVPDATYLLHPWSRGALLLMFAASASALNITPLDLPLQGVTAQPSITSNRSTGFILTWQQKHDNHASLHFAELDNTGKLQRQGPIAESTPEHPWFLNWADFPSLVVLDNGDWITYWLQKRSSGTYAYDIHLTRSTNRGKTWSESILPHRDATATEHGFVSLVPQGRDRVLAIWLDGRNTGTSGSAHDHAEGAGAMTLRSAVINRAGALSDESEIDARTCDCCNTDAARVGKNTLLIYRDRSNDEIRDMAFSVRSRGGKWSAPSSVHNDHWKISGCPVNGPALAVNGQQALAVWTTMQGDDLAVRFALGGVDGFGPMLELERSALTQGHVDATAWGDKAYLVSWVGQHLQPSGHAIRLAVIDREQVIRQHDLLSALANGSNPGMPRVAAAGQAAIAVWTESAEGHTTIKAALIREQAKTNAEDQ
jgi:hypothetical protein